MATTSKYYVLTSPLNNQNFLDFGLNYGDGTITTAGESILYNGTSQTDAIFVRPGLTYDLTSTLSGTDKIYLTGNLADYNGTVSGGSLTLTRISGPLEVVTVSGGSSLQHDNLIFANGTVSANALWDAVTKGTAKPAPDTSEVSGSPNSGGAAPGATLNATVKAFAVGAAAVNGVGETFASTKPGISFVANGGQGIDKVYVADGEVVDATSLGLSVDLIYMRGKWADYNKSVENNGSKLVFTRTLQPSGSVESVSVAAGSSVNYDQLIFADGAVFTDDARDALVGNPLVGITQVKDYIATTTTPLFNDAEVAAALAILKTAADANNANGSVTPPVTALTASAYTNANVKNVDPSNVAAINSALDSAGIAGAMLTNTAAVQKIVDAYNAILLSADGPMGTTSAPITGDQYAAIGVTGLPAGTGTPADGSALKLLDEVVDKSTTLAVNTEAKLQAMADAANHVLTAAGGTAADANNLTVADLNALGFATVTPDNIVAIRDAIKAILSDDSIDQQAELAGVITTAIAGIGTELTKISTAAGANNAGATLVESDYTKAGVSGVTSSNLAAINSALDSTIVDAGKTNTTPKVQAIVNAYQAILDSADGPSGTTSTPITGDQYAVLGVTGLPTGSGTPGTGTALKLLDEVVDQSLTAAVNTESKLQAMADAANHVLTAAGGTAAEAAVLSIADLAALGFTATPDNIVAIRTVIQGTTSDSDMDQKAELAAAITAAIGGITAEVNKISVAAGADNAGATITAADYGKANVSGVDAGNVAAINSALDSLPVNAASTNTTAKLQAIVNTYNAILASADGSLGNTSPAITGEQYASLGLTGVPTGSPVNGSSLKLLDEVVDQSLKAAVDSETKLQAMVNAANHVLTAASGTVAEANALSVADLNALGFTNVTGDNIVAIRDAIKATPDANIDQHGELKGVIDTALAGIVSELTKISAAAEANNAGGNPAATPPVTALAVTDYTKAGVSGVTTSNLAAVNSALDSLAVHGSDADSTKDVQGIVNAYQAIINSADGIGENTGTPITGDQYAAIGVTGIPTGPGAPSEGGALYLLDSAIDAAQFTAVATESGVQAMANAAAHVIAAAGTAQSFTAAELTALGVTGITTPGLLAEMLSAVHAKATSGVDTLGELQTIANGIVNNHAVLSSTVGSATALDVSSNLVFTSSIAVNAGSGLIHITDKGGAGYHGDANTNSMDISMATAISSGLVSIDSTHKIITINPMWDMDLSSNYSISIDAGAFVGVASGLASDAVAAINFSTVTPGLHTTGTVSTEARASQSMNGAGDLVTSGRAWMDIEGLGSILGGVTQLGDLSGGSYVLVAKNYATSPGGAGGDGTDGIRLLDTNVGVANFGANDIVYFDSQVNDTSKQVFDGHYTAVVDGNTFGGNAGQNALDMATVGAPTTQASGARIMLGLAGNTGNQQYGTIYQDGSNHGWATDWHPASDPVIMA